MDLSIESAFNLSSCSTGRPSSGCTTRIARRILLDISAGGRVKTNSTIEFSAKLLPQVPSQAGSWLSSFCGMYQAANTNFLINGARGSPFVGLPEKTYETGCASEKLDIARIEGSDLLALQLKAPGEGGNASRSRCRQSQFARGE